MAGTRFLLLTIPFVFGCGRQMPNDGANVRDFQTPVRIVIQGYPGNAMEPALSPDGRYLFFNNLNDPATNTNLFYAERIDDTTFAFRGPLAGTNGPVLDAVASLDVTGAFYFITTRSY